MSGLGLPGEALRGLVLFVPKDNPIYRLHPVTKITLIIVATTIAYALTNVLYIALMNLVLGLLLVYARIPFNSLKLFLKAITWFLLIIILSNAFLANYPGITLLSFSILGLYTVKVTSGNLLFGATFALRLLTMSLASALLIITTKQRDLIYGLRHLRIPYTLIFIIALALRIMVTFAVDILTIMEAQQSRGLDYSSGNLIKRMKKLAMIGVPLTVISIKRIVFLSNAVETRAFGSGIKRSYFFELKLARSDKILIPLLLLIASSILYASYLGLT